MIDVDPRTQKHLISDQGEIVIDEVSKHWAALVGASLELVAGLLVPFIAIAAPKIWWLPVLIGMALVLHAGWRILDRRRDHFVITNMRVFRIHGILAEHIATMPLSRILDISVDKPFIGRILGYGHFVFESAAQEQGLRDIRYVGRPDERGLTIQRVIQQAGLRGMAGRLAADGMQGSVPAVPSMAGASAQTYETAPYEPIRPVEIIKPYDPDNTSTDPIQLPR